MSCYPNTIKNLIHDFRNEGKEIIWKDNSIWLSRGAQAVTEDVVLPTCLSDDKEITFGVMSDLHYGSRSCQITAINLFAEECKKNGVEHIFVAGDILAGYGIYKGQTMETYEQSAEHQEESCLVNLPAGFKYYMIGGNHDYSYMKIAGHNVIRSLSRQREDINYCGFDWAEIEIMKNVSVGLWHPSGGVPYSISYRLQKGVEQMAFEELTKIVEGHKERPTLRFLFAGHLHIQLQALFGSVLGMQCGCFEGSNSYLKAKKLVPAIGGYIVHAKLGKNGLLKDFSTKFHLFPEIIGDWKNYSHRIKHDEIIKPMF